MSDDTPVRFGIIGNVSKGDLLPAVITVLGEFDARGMSVLVENEICAAMAHAGLRLPDTVVPASRTMLAEQSEYLLAFGGDGTMLAVAHDALPFGTPIVGVNLGKLGFLADLNSDGVMKAVDAILNGQHTIEERITLTGRISNAPEEHTALNDFVVSKSGRGHVIRIDTHVNGDYLATFNADGIIAATPTGSTAYSLASGGPIVVPSSSVVILSPISAHALTARPLVLPDSVQIEMRAYSAEGDIMVMVDGRIVTTVAGEVSVRIARGSRTVRLVKNIGPDYFEMLRTKLSWAVDLRSPSGAAQ